MEAYLLSGEYDYLIKVAVAGTEGYERFLRQKLYKLPGVRHTRSTFALRCLKRSPSVNPG
jgi:Lrp/AsnC family leucine-responsive transcriptional regulator